jgi:flagellin
MTVINSNSAAMLTANSISQNDRMMTQTMERLSTGKRINSAADDAAGLAIATKMTSQIRGLDQAGRNANNATSMIQLADGSAEQISNILQRMREIVVQAADGSNSATDINVINVEFKEAAEEIDRIVDATEFNGKKLLNGDAGGVAGSSDSTVDFQIGANAGQRLEVDFADFGLEAGGAGTSTSTWSGSDALVGDIRNLGASETIDFAFTRENGTSVTLQITQGNITATAATDFSDATLLHLRDALNTAITADPTLSDISASVSVSGELVFTDSGVGANGGTVDSVSSATTGTQTLGQSGANPMGTNLSDFKGTGMGGDYTATLNKLDAAIEGIATQRATFGASMNRLEYAVDNLASSSLATATARGRIEDANYATETTSLARSQIIAQAGTAMLAQANQKSQSVLSLLQ